MKKTNTILKNLPDASGIYLFYNEQRELIYVGKATSLRNRVRSYFRGARTLRPIEQMIHEVADIKIKETDSVLEAIILEGSYIKKYRPKYNIDWKDDKSWNYIVVTKDDYPVVKTMRSHEMLGGGGRVQRDEDFRYMFGPFPGMRTREMMRLLQRLFFISHCKPQKKSTERQRDLSMSLPSNAGEVSRDDVFGRPCLYNQIGQCLGICTGEISAKEYRHKVIRPLAMFLWGNKKGVIKNLEKEMKLASAREDFEEAARLRNQIEMLQHIHDVVLLNKSFVEIGSRDRSRPVPTRIEGYDISNLGASGKVGSMVVFSAQGGSVLGGEYFPEKSAYRKFKIKTVEGQSDVDCLEEVLRRRLARIDTRNDAEKNTDKNYWSKPDVVLIDGGKPQVNRVVKILKELYIDIPVIGIAKGPARKKNEFIFANDTDETDRTKKKEFVFWVNDHQHLLIRVRDEAHRFAIAYQRKLRKVV